MWTPQMIINERTERANELGHTNSFHVGCGCIPCRNYYDPTGEEECLERNEKIVRRQAACEAAGVPNYGDFSSLNFDEETKAFLKDAYDATDGKDCLENYNMGNNPDMFKMNSWNLMFMVDRMKLIDKHTDATFAVIARMIRDIHTDGWIKFAQKHKA